MNVHIHLALDTTSINDEVTGNSSEDVVTQIRDRVAKEMGFLVGGFIKRMTPLDFAREATRRYNAATNDTAPPPATCDDFIKMAVVKGFATIRDSGSGSAGNAA